MKKLLIVSFPKSGNTIIRQFMICYNFLINSDYDELVKLSYEFNISNYNKKSNINPDQLKITKTHLPSKYININDFFTILVVRDPLNSWWSLYNYQKSIHDNLFIYPKFFKFFRFLFTIENWLDFHKNWLKKLEKNKNYIIIDFKLLKNDKVNTLKNLVYHIYNEVDEKKFNFALEQISIEKMKIAQENSLMMNNKFNKNYMFASKNRPIVEKNTQIKLLKLTIKHQDLFNFIDKTIYDYKFNYYLTNKIFMKYKLSKIFFWIQRKINFSN